MIVKVESFLWWHCVFNSSKSFQKYFVTLCLHKGTTKALHNHRASWNFILLIVSHNLNNTDIRPHHLSLLYLYSYVAIHCPNPHNKWITTISWSRPCNNRLYRKILALRWKEILSYCASSMKKKMNIKMPFSCLLLFS